MPASRPATPDGTNLADILERVLDRGVVIAGDIKISLLDIELLTIKLRLVVASVDTAREMGIDWWERDPFLSSRPRAVAADGDLPAGGSSRAVAADGNDASGMGGQPALPATRHTAEEDHAGANRAGDEGDARPATPRGRGDRSDAPARHSGDRSHVPRRRGDLDRLGRRRGQR